MPSGDSDGSNVSQRIPRNTGHGNESLDEIAMDFIYKKTPLSFIRKVYSVHKVHFPPQVKRVD
jgi:hypothetical protein